MIRQLPVCLTKVLAIILCLFSHYAIAQNIGLDSLNKALTKTNQDSAKVNIFIKLSQQFENAGKYTLADSVARKGLQLANKIGFKNGQAASYKKLGRIYDAQGNYSGALDNYSKALEIRKQLNDKLGTAYLLNDIGWVNRENANYLQALDYFFEALKISLELNNKYAMALIYNNIGVVYTDQGKYPDALKEQFSALKELEEIHDNLGIASTHEYIGNIYTDQMDYTKALEQHFIALKLREDNHDSLNIANSLSNVGLTYLELGKDSMALDYYNQSLKIRNSIGDKNGIAISLINIGGIYFSEKKYDKAYDYINRSLSIFQGIGNKDGIVNCLDAIGQIYQEQKEFANALEYEKKELNLAKEIGSLSDISNAYERLSDISELMGNYRDALDFNKDYIKARDSLNNKENTKKSIATELNFEFQKKQAVAKAEQDNKDFIEREQQRKQRLVIYFISGILILVLAFAIFAYRNYLQKQRVNLELDEKNQKLESAYEELDEKNKDITDSINYAKRIQTAILVPKEEIARNLNDFFIYFRPKDIVSGDFYYYSHLKTDAISKIIIAAADCTGHGVPGAFMSMIGNDVLTQVINEKNISQPAEILSKLHDGVRKALKQDTSKAETMDGMDIAMCSFNPQSNEVQFAGALRNLYLLRKENSELEEIKGDRRSIGGSKTEVLKTFTNHTIKLDKGDTFYICSDGYADQFGGPRQKKFMSKNFEKLLTEMRHLSMADQEKTLHTNFESWKGQAEQVDDVLVIGIRA